MEIRKLCDPRDWLESERVIQTAFLHPWDEDEASKKAHAQADGMMPRHHESWGLFGEDQTMMTSISTARHQLCFGGESIGAGEVHMVGSLPEYRGGGAVRALMGEILRDFRARGDALAVLIPFSCAFYRKFGFETASLMVQQRVGIDQLAGFRCDLRVTRVWEEADLASVRAVWDAFAAGHDLCELRGDDTYAWRGNGEFGEPDFIHPERQRYTYVFWDKNAPRAYVRFSFFHEPDRPFVGELEVNELVWLDPVSLRAALGFLYRMRAKVSHVNVELPHLELATLVPETDQVEQSVDCHVMARLLDPERLLRLMPQPHGAGCYAMRIDDAFMPEVAGCWRVTYADGRAVAVERTDKAPDLVADATVACQLILGRIGLDEALYRDGVEVLGNEDVLARVFVRRPVHLAL